MVTFNGHLNGYFGMGLLPLDESLVRDCLLVLIRVERSVERVIQV